MHDSVAHARGWFLKAESDLATVERLLEGDGPYDTACFHAQQAAEKYLKGLLAFHGQPVLPTHNLEQLERMCVGVEPQLTLNVQDLVELTPYAVQLRYDFEFWPERDVADEALEIARRVRTIVLAAVPEAARP